MTAYGGRDDKLFHGVFAESVSTPILRDVSQSRYIYEALLDQTKCSNLDCLRSLDAKEFQAAVKAVRLPYPGAPGKPVFMYNPALDHDFINEGTYDAFKNGRFVHVPTVMGDDTNDGVLFTPKNIDSHTSFDDFLKSNFVNLTDPQLAELRGFYELNTTKQLNQDVFVNASSQAFGDLRYLCPSLYFSNAIDSAQPSVDNYFYHWDVGKANHVAELGSIWGSGNPGTVDHKFQSYFTSFVRTLNPNQFKDPGTPDWEQWGNNDKYRRIRLGDNAKVEMESVSAEEKQKCSFINDIGPGLMQ
jgi:carboxylesterase type B